LPPQVVPLQIGNNEAADMPTLGFAALRHVVNSQTLSESQCTNRFGERACSARARIVA
jgi:hypothetical protein